MKSHFTIISIIMFSSYYASTKAYLAEEYFMVLLNDSDGYQPLEIYRQHYDQGLNSSTTILHCGTDHEKVATVEFAAAVLPTAGRPVIGLGETAVWLPR